MSGVLAFDIETYGDWADVPERLQAYLTKRDEQRGIGPDDRRAVAQRVGLLPGLAQVVAIGLWSEVGGSALVLVPDLAEAEEARTSEGVALRCFRDEVDLLRAFWVEASDAVSSGRRLVTFHGREFDGPMLALRSAALGVRPTVHLAGPRESLSPHCDLAQVLGFLGARRERFSLDYWCGVFGVPSPKGDMNGAEVQGAFERADHAAIGRYASADAEAAGELFRKLEGTVLPLLEETAH